MDNVKERAKKIEGGREKEWEITEFLKTNSPPLNLVDGRGSDKRSGEPVPNCNNLHTGDAQHVIKPKMFLYLGGCVHIKTNLNQ